MSRSQRAFLSCAALALIATLAACTQLQRLAHVYSKDALQAQVQTFEDGATALYYSFDLNEAVRPDTFVFFAGGSGCASWKYVMPGYAEGLPENARVFALNKRHVSDRSTGMLGCGDAFELANHPQQWLSDFVSFVEARLSEATEKPEHVILVGVSEGALTAVRAAGVLSAVTHLAVIGDGAFSMRESLDVLRDKGQLSLDIDAGWQSVLSDPRSIEKRWFGNSYRWWSAVMDLDPRPDYLGLDIPILLAMGESDTSVPVESAQALAAEFARAGKDNLHLFIYPAANHQLQSKAGNHRTAFFRDLSQALNP